MNLCSAAFAVASLADAERRLKHYSIEYHKFLVPGTNASQIFLYDPEGKYSRLTCAECDCNLTVEAQRPAPPFTQALRIKKVVHSGYLPLCIYVAGTDVQNSWRFGTCIRFLQVLKLALVLGAGNGVELGEHYEEIARSLLGK